jgi:hypothetical protein
MRLLQSKVDTKTRRIPCRTQMHPSEFCSCGSACGGCWAEARIKIARMTLTIKLDRNWSSFQLANSAPPLSVTDSAIAPSARMLTHAREQRSTNKVSLQLWFLRKPVGGQAREPWVHGVVEDGLGFRVRVEGPDLEVFGTISPCFKKCKNHCKCYV